MCALLLSWFLCDDELYSFLVRNRNAKVMLNKEKRRNLWCWGFVIGYHSGALVDFSPVIHYFVHFCEFILAEPFPELVVLHCISDNLSGVFRIMH
jgi:hypothetical protein